MTSEKLSGSSLRARSLAVLNWGVALVIFYFAFKAMLPTGGNRAQFIQFTLAFYTVSALLALSLTALGRVFRQRILRAQYSLVDLALGFGLFSLILNIWIKLTLSPILPLTILGLFLVFQIRHLHSNRAQLKESLQAGETPWLLLLFTFLIFGVSLTPGLDGFLVFPHDYDSGIFHVTFPKQVMREGHYFNPLWLRAPWHPQLTHNWYIFVLKWAGDLFLKTANVFAFLQITFLFCRGNARKWMIGPLLLAIVACGPEFRAVITTTSLDAVLALFTFAAFATAHEFCVKRDPRLLFLLALLCGFAGGQKHFGLMFSAPLLGFTSLLYLFERKESLKAKLPRVAWLASVAAVFAFTFIPFYFHNVLSGTALLFPFFGSHQNGYGWTASEIHDFLTSAIPHWGHSKTWVGLLQLPAHLVNFPEDYQFYKVSAPYDYLISIEILLVYVAVLATLFWKRLRRAEFILPALMLLAQVISWYKSSQVIRYLFPLSINIAYFFAVSLTSSFNSISLIRMSKRFALGASLVALLGAFWFSEPFSRKPIPEPPLTQAAREEWLTKYISPAIPAYVWLRDHSPVGTRALHIGSSAMTQFFPETILCGDWFSECRYPEYLIYGGVTTMKLKEWSEIGPKLKNMGVSHFILMWTTFGGLRPDPKQNWITGIPPSAMKCLEHRFHDGHMTDVFEIKPECR